MRYVSSVERFGIEKGVLQGRRLKAGKKASYAS
ncbi:MAG: hypothetical protein RLZ92_301 [Pseudomonadota bacterium]